MSVLLLVAAGALLGFAAGVAAGRLAWLVLMVVALVIYVSVGTGADVPPDWMVWAIPVVPFAFVGVGIGIGVRRALHEDSPRARTGFSLPRRSASGPGTIERESDLAEAIAVLSLMLDVDFDGAEAYRRQLDVATLTRHATGYGILVDRARAAPAAFDAARPRARLPVEAAAHGDMAVRLHAFEGYLDELELLDGARFPDPTTVRIRST